MPHSYHLPNNIFISSVAQSCPTLCDPMDCSMPGLPVHHRLPEFTQIHVHQVSDAIKSSHLLSSPSPPALNLSRHQDFSNESALWMRWPKYWSFSLSISPSNEHLGLISFRMDWLDLLAVQGTFKSLLQHHSSKASILQCSTFFIVQLSHPYVTAGKTTALTRWMFVGKVTSLLFLRFQEWGHRCLCRNAPHIARATHSWFFLSLTISSGYTTFVLQERVFGHTWVMTQQTW